MSSLGKEYRTEGLKKAAVYVFSRERLLKESQKITEKATEVVLEIDDDDIEPRPKEEAQPEKVETVKKEFYIVGGDYFGKEDIDSLKADGMSTLERFSTIRMAEKEDEVKNERVEEEIKKEDNFTDESFYTETLAKIYAAQGFYQRALEVYEKLILLYPEKSTYFAALKEEIKKHL